ncbi:MAG: hypothetical protein DMF79_14690 [Acidobacteria bacterium]|nr:MAG: hypothetical protein DMF79_14690 [Acidobacteriota bacterium]
MRPSWARLALPLLVLAVVVAFLFAMLSSTGGRFVPQVVDLYVVCQYARAMAEGHPFRYNPGESPSTGSTSLLYTAWLGGAHAVGIRGEALVAFAIVTGALLFAASVFLARRIGTTLAGESAGGLAGALLALGGPIAWSFLYGSDIALYMFLALLLLDRWLAFWAGGSARGFAVAGSLLALARPEGLWIGALLGGASLRRPSGRQAGGWLPALPAVTGVLVLAMNRAVTGDWLGTSVADKSLLANYGLRDTVSLVSEYAVDVLRGLLLGFYPSQAPLGFSRGWAPFYFPPLGLLFILLAVLRAPEPLRAPLRWWLATVALVCALVSANVFMGVHFNRYLMWAFPGLLVIAAVGLRFATGLADRDPSFERALLRAGAGLFLALGLLSTARFAALYGEMAGSVARRDLALAEWIRQKLPAGVAMANLATSVEYLTGHRNLNLHGVTTPAFFGNRTAEREAGMFESLGRLPEGDRPPYLISSASLQEGSALLKELVAGPPLFQTVSFSDELQVFGLRYDLVGKNHRMFAPEALEAVRGLREVDRLNVCDSEDERRHRYRFSSHLGDVRLFGAVRIDAYTRPGGNEMVADAGRAILGSETFHVRAERGRDLVVVLRTAPALEVATRQASLTGLLPLEIPEAGLLVQVGDDRSLPPLTFRPQPGWNEVVFRIPGGLLSEGETAIHLKGRYASFQYWFFQ